MREKPTELRLRYIRNVDLLFKMDSTTGGLLTKTFFFFFTLETVLKNGEATSRGDFESISARE